MQGKGQIMIAGSNIILPEFMQLLVQGSRFKDRLEGDDGENLFKSSSGGDILIGKGGSDYYLIDSSDVGDEISIENYDIVEVDTLEQDMLMLPISIADICMTQKDNDIIFSHRYLPKKYPKVRVIDFMLNESYRHLSLMDKDGRIHVLTINRQGRASLRLDKIISEPSNKPTDNTHETKLIEVLSLFDSVKNIMPSTDEKPVGVSTINTVSEIFTHDSLLPIQ